MNKQTGSIYAVITSVVLVILLGILGVLGFNTWTKQQLGQSQKPKQSIDSSQSSVTKLGEIAYVDMTKTIYPVPDTPQTLHLRVENVARDVKYYFNKGGKIEELQPDEGNEWVRVKVTITSNSKNTKEFQAVSDYFVYVTSSGKDEYPLLLIYPSNSDKDSQLYATTNNKGSCDDNGHGKSLEVGGSCQYYLYYTVPANDRGSLEYRHPGGEVGAKLLLR